jgi:hypothetical protein
MASAQEVDLPTTPQLTKPPFQRPGQWVFEEKIDGWRMLAYRDRAAVRLISRDGVDHTRRFRALAAAISKLPAQTFVLDGEVAVYDERLVSRFQSAARRGERVCAAASVPSLSTSCRSDAKTSAAARYTSAAPSSSNTCTTPTWSCPAAACPTIPRRRGRSSKRRMHRRRFPSARV